MAFLEADRNTPMKDPGLVVLPVSSDQEIFAGAIVVVGIEAGYASGGYSIPGLVYIGRAEEYVSNLDGASGDKTVQVRRGKAFKFNNSATDPVSQSSFGSLCYIEDDQTVAKTSNAETLSAAGIVLGIESDGVWVL